MAVAWSSTLKLAGVGMGVGVGVALREAPCSEESPSSAVWNVATDSRVDDRDGSVSGLLGPAVGVGGAASARETVVVGSGLLESADGPSCPLSLSPSTPLSPGARVTLGPASTVGLSNGGGRVSRLASACACACAATPYGTPNLPTVSRELMNFICSVVGPFLGYANSVRTSVCGSGALMGPRDEVEGDVRFTFVVDGVRMERMERVRGRIWEIREEDGVSAEPELDVDMVVVRRGGTVGELGTGGTNGAGIVLVEAADDVDGINWDNRAAKLRKPDRRAECSPGKGGQLVLAAGVGVAGASVCDTTAAVEDSATGVTIPRSDMPSWAMSASPATSKYGGASPMARSSSALGWRECPGGRSRSARWLSSDPIRNVSKLARCAGGESSARMRGV